jgi:hypothetical protein
MAKHLWVITCETIIGEVLARHGVNPRVQPIPIESMASIARDVRHELDRAGLDATDLDRCFDRLVEDIVNTSMTADGRTIAIEHLTAGFRSETV